MVLGKFVFSTFNYLLGLLLGWRFACLWFQIVTYCGRVKFALDMFICWVFVSASRPHEVWFNFGCILLETMSCMGHYSDLPTVWSWSRPRSWIRLALLSSSDVQIIWLRSLVIEIFCLVLLVVEVCKVRVVSLHLHFLVYLLPGIFHCFVCVAHFIWLHLLILHLHLLILVV